MPVGHGWSVNTDKCSICLSRNWESRSRSAVCDVFWESAKFADNLVLSSKADSNFMTGLFWATSSEEHTASTNVFQLPFFWEAHFTKNASTNIIMLRFSSHKYNYLKSATPGVNKRE